MAMNPIHRGNEKISLKSYPVSILFFLGALSLETMTMQKDIYIFQVTLLQNKIENSCGVPVWRQCPYAVSGQNTSCTAHCRPLNRNDEYYVVILKLLPHADDVHLVTEIDIFW